jgi:hypothetical protein
MLYKLSAVLAVAALSLAVAGTAVAFDCTVAKKPATAGAVGIIDIKTPGDPDDDEFTPLKNNPGEDRPHGGFVALTDGVNSTSTFLHAPERAEGVMPPVREGGPHNNCDGKGLDSIELCFPEEE